MKITDEQRRVIQEKQGPILVLAGPGAGKTTTLLERINYLAQEVDPSKILTLTFSKAQAQDMRERFKRNKSNFMTIHAFCYLIIRNFLKKYNREIRLLETDDSYNKYDLVKKIYYEINNKKISSEDLREFFSKISYMKNAMLEEAYLKKLRIKNALAIYRTYEDFKREHFFIDFDDMQVLALDLINNDKALLRSIRRRYDYIQVDEGQDTSLIQFKIIEQIAQPKNNLLIVADDDQSIYSFRAADVSYLLNFKKTYPDGKILTLRENHRSTQEIVTRSQDFIKTNKHRYEKDLFTKNYNKSQVEVKVLKDVYDQYNFIKKNLDPNSKNAILFRNNIQAINILSFLMEDKIPFTYKFSEKDFFDSKIINDLFEIIRFSEDFYDRESFSEIYYKIESYLSKDDIKKLDYKGINQSVFDFYYREGLPDSKLDRLIEREKQFNHIRNMSLDRKINYIYKYMGYKSYITGFSNKYREEIVNKDLFIESLVNFTKGLKTLDEFYGKLENLNELKNDEDSTLTLSTIHRSKGLEYDNVFVINLNENEFPMLIGDNLDEKIEEERRLMYVAMTRAKTNLYLLSFKKRGRESLNPSVFIKEIKGLS